MSYEPKQEAGDVWINRRSSHWGHSRFIAVLSTMPVKNNAIIYDELYHYLFYSLEFKTLSEENRTHHTFVLRKIIAL